MAKSQIRILVTPSELSKLANLKPSGDKIHGGNAFEIGGSWESGVTEFWRVEPSK